MVFDPEGCWDCPVRPGTLFGVFLATLLVAFLGSFLLLRRQAAARALGALLLAVSTLWAAAFSSVGPRWGIDWHSNGQSGNPAISRVVFYSWLVLTIVIGAMTIAQVRIRRRA